MAPKKFLIFDAGPLISMTMAGLLDVLEKLKENFDGEFVITPTVKKEVVDRPLKIKKYALEGVKIQDLLDRKILRLSSDFVSNSSLSKKRNEILKRINSAFISDENKKIELIHSGEAECLAFSKLCGVKNLIVIDERTTRLVAEAPGKLENLMEKKLHTKIEVVGNFDFVKDVKFVRSAELMFLAYKKNLFEMKKSKTLLGAVLYGLKFNGTAISSDEIEEMKRLG